MKKKDVLMTAFAIGDSFMRYDNVTINLYECQHVMENHLLREGTLRKRGIKPIPSALKLLTDAQRMFKRKRTVLESQTNYFIAYVCWNKDNMPRSNGNEFVQFQSVLMMHETYEDAKAHSDRSTNSNIAVLILPGNLKNVTIRIDRHAFLPMGCVFRIVNSKDFNLKKNVQVLEFQTIGMEPSKSLDRLKSCRLKLVPDEVWFLEKVYLVKKVRAFLGNFDNIQRDENVLLKNFDTKLRFLMNYTRKSGKLSRREDLMLFSLFKCRNTRRLNKKDLKRLIVYVLNRFLFVMRCLTNPKQHALRRLATVAFKGDHWYPVKLMSNKCRKLAEFGEDVEIEQQHHLTNTPNILLISYHPPIVNL